MTVTFTKYDCCVKTANDDDILRLNLPPVGASIGNFTNCISKARLNNMLRVYFRRKSEVRFPGPLNRTQCHHRLATAAMFLRSCVAQALSRGDGPRHSLHASV